MERRGFFARMAGALAEVFGIGAVASARDISTVSSVPRFSIEFENGYIHLTPVLSHIVDHETRLKLAGPIRQMERAVFDALDKHPADSRYRTDREGIALNQAALTLQELRLALNRKYPW